MLSTPILLDYQSSTPCSKDVVDSMKPFWSEIFSNPANKSNLAGINASAILEASREKIEQSLFLKNKKVIFTSGATESNNLLNIQTRYRVLKLTMFKRNLAGFPELRGRTSEIKHLSKALLALWDQGQKSLATCENAKVLRGWSVVRGMRECEGLDKACTGCMIATGHADKGCTGGMLVSGHALGFDQIVC